MAVDGVGTPWVLASNGSIYKWKDGNWVNIPGCAKDIGVGMDGTVGVLGCAQAPGGWEVFRLKPDNTWEKFPGGLIRLDVYSTNVFYGTNNGNNIYITKH